MEYEKIIQRFNILSYIFKFIIQILFIYFLLLLILTFIQIGEINYNIDYHPFKIQNITTVIVTIFGYKSIDALRKYLHNLRNYITQFEDSN